MNDQAPQVVPTVPDATVVNPSPHACVTQLPAKPERNPSYSVSVLPATPPQGQVRSTNQSKQVQVKFTNQSAVGKTEGGACKKGVVSGAGSGEEAGINGETAPVGKCERKERHSEETRVKAKSNVSSERASSVPVPSRTVHVIPVRRANSAHTADRVSQAFDRSIEEALGLLMEASSAEKKRRAAARARGEVTPKTHIATSGSAKKRVLEAPTEENALAILMGASRDESRRRRSLCRESAKRNEDSGSSQALLLTVCPAYGQSARDVL